MNKQFVAIVVVVLVGLFGIFYFNKDSAKAPVSGDDNSNSQTTGSNHTLGENAKSVTLVEYGDFQCPACAAYEPIVKEIREKYQEDISFQFRHFPLQQIHPNARAASRAAEAAGRQDKFWEMHDLLYEQQQVWSSSTTVNSIFEGYAQQLDLDIEQYKQDFASESVNDVINEDFSLGTQDGVNSTPSFILQGELINDPPQDIEGFSELIDKAIAENN
jgi:protein-disulfide isomerase